MSQTIKTLISLREMILNNELPAGTRLREVQLAKQLQTSRTPLRMALMRLAEEGLLERNATVGYTVREFTLRDVEEAIELRGTIEGVAARLAAERGVEERKLAKLREIVHNLTDLLNDRSIRDETMIERYFELNRLFHDKLRGLIESFVIEHLYSRLDGIPFASPNAFVIAQSHYAQSRLVLQIGNAQHRAIVEALEKRQGGRVEHITREHARLSHQTLSNSLQDRSLLEQVQGSNLILNAIQTDVER